MAGTLKYDMCYNNIRGKNMQNIKTLTVFISIIMLLSFLPIANAVPVDPEEVISITDVSFTTQAYVGQSYTYLATAKNATGVVIPRQACRLDICELSNPQICPEFQEIRRMCRDSENVPVGFADDCYYLTGSGGIVSFNVMPLPELYKTNTDYTFTVTCDEVSVSKTATILGINSGGPCNVSSIKIQDGTDLTTDIFDENPNKFDKLYVSYFLSSYNTTCINENVRYKILRDINGTWVSHSETKETTSDINGTGVISIEMDLNYFVGGVYKLEIMADDKSDSVEFTVNTMRPSVEGYETLDWATQNMNGLLALVAMLILIIIGLVIIWKLGFS